MIVLGHTKLATSTRPSLYFNTLTTLLMVTTYLLSLVLHDLSVILGVLGAVATVPVTLTLPGLYLVRLSRQEEEGGSTMIRDRLLGWSFVVLGMCISIFCLYATLRG